MDRDVSPRVAYWTSSFRPAFEAVASEVALLREAFPGSIAWGVSPRDWGTWSWRKGFAMHPALQLAFRGATGVLQRAFHINHLFGSLGDWFHLKAVAKHPTVMTVALSGDACESPLLDKVDRFVVEWEGAKRQLEELGVQTERARLIYPPVDLDKFSPLPAPSDVPFTVLFASSPDRADWLEARGVDQIMDAAKLRPDVRFRLLWRPWGDGESRVRRWIEERDVRNVELAVGRVPCIWEEYQRAHVTIAPFSQMKHCKPVPNSLVESMACGRPIILSDRVGIAELVREFKAGAVADCGADSIVECLDRIRADWNEFSHNARRAAEMHFDRHQFVRAYASVYEELL